MAFQQKLDLGIKLFFIVNDWSCNGPVGPVLTFGKRFSTKVRLIKRTKPTRPTLNVCLGQLSVCIEVCVKREMTVLSVYLSRFTGGIGL